VAPNAKLKLGKVNADVYTLPINPTPEDYKIADRLTQANLTKRIDVGNHYSSQADVKRGDINARLVARESVNNVASSSSTATQSPFTPSRSTSPAVSLEMIIIDSIDCKLSVNWPKVPKEKVEALAGILEEHADNCTRADQVIRNLKQKIKSISFDDERELDNLISEVNACLAPIDNERKERAVSPAGLN